MFRPTQLQWPFMDKNPFEVSLTNYTVMTKFKFAKRLHRIFQKYHRSKPKAKDTIALIRLFPLAVAYRSTHRYTTRHHRTYSPPTHSHPSCIRSHCLHGRDFLKSHQMFHETFRMLWKYKCHFPGKDLNLAQQKLL